MKNYNFNLFNHRFIFQQEATPKPVEAEDAGVDTNEELTNAELVQSEEDAVDLANQYIQSLLQGLLKQENREAAKAGVQKLGGLDGFMNKITADFYTEIEAQDLKLNPNQRAAVDELFNQYKKQLAEYTKRT